MLKRALQSLYLKIFLSFLATCMLIFVALAVFWNFFLQHYYYKDKREFMALRENELARIYQMYFEGSLATRELRISLRIIARSVNGEAWIVDRSGSVVLSSTADWEGEKIPQALEEPFAGAMQGHDGFATVKFRNTEGEQYASFLTRYASFNQGNQRYALFLFTPVDDLTNTIFAVRWSIWVPLLFSLIAVGLILYIISRRLTGPLQEMNRVTHAIADEGDFSVRIPVQGQDEIAQLAQSFNAMLGKLQQWEDTRQEFLTNVSHELRSPLTSLRGLITGMYDGVIPQGQQSRYLQICIDEVLRLERLVSGLLDLARIQNGTETFRLRPLDVVNAAQEAIDLVAPQIDKKGLRLEVWIPGEEAQPLIVLLDPDCFAQILNNLLYNAIQFTPEGRTITIYLGKERDEFVLKVKDTGIGMTEEELARIWDRFYKADPSRGIRPEGTGLGLTIVRHLVRGMQGTIQVTSEVGQGTEFTVRFPLDEAASQTAAFGTIHN